MRPPSPTTQTKPLHAAYLNNFIDDLRATGDRRLKLLLMDGALMHMCPELAMQLLNKGLLTAIDVSHSSCQIAVNDNRWNSEFKRFLDEEV